MEFRIFEVGHFARMCKLKDYIKFFETLNSLYIYIRSYAHTFLLVHMYEGMLPGGLCTYIKSFNIIHH